VIQQGGRSPQRRTDILVQTPWDCVGGFPRDPAFGHKFVRPLQTADALSHIGSQRNAIGSCASCLPETSRAGARARASFCTPELVALLSLMPCPDHICAVHVARRTMINRPVRARQLSCEELASDSWPRLQHAVPFADREGACFPMSLSGVGSPGDGLLSPGEGIVCLMGCRSGMPVPVPRQHSS
jgi:hypothetical protein